ETANSNLIWMDRNKIKPPRLCRRGIFVLSLRCFGKRRPALRVSGPGQTDGGRQMGLPALVSKTAAGIACSRPRPDSRPPPNEIPGLRIENGGRSLCYIFVLSTGLAKNFCVSVRITL